MYFFHYLGAFLFGAAVSQTTTDIAKYMLGRLRPHWFDICQPDYTKFKCVEDNVIQYIDGDVCTGDPKLIREARYIYIYVFIIKSI